MWYVCVCTGVRFDHDLFQPFYCGFILGLRNISSIDSCFNRVYVMTWYLSIIQLEQEIDLILEKRDVFKSALQDWTSSWVPAIIQYGESAQTGKTAAVVVQAKKDYEGTYLCYT